MPAFVREEPVERFVRKLCCGQVKHEVDWKCGAASSDDKAACCENWDEQCWNVASDQNLGHACNQCDYYNVDSIMLLVGAAPSDGDGDGNDDDKDSDTSDDSSDSERTGSEPTGN